MKRKAKIITVTAAAGILVLAGVFAVYAYFTDNAKTDNTLFPAENELEISEDYVPPVEQKTGENIYKKEISVINRGNAPCYIRVYMDFSDSTVSKRSYLSNDPSQSPDSFYKAERTDASDTYISHLDLVAPGWTFVPDASPTALAGYYYYKEPVAPGEKTTSLLTFVKTLNESNDDIKQYDIMVYAESVQVSDMKGKKYENFEEAWTDILQKAE